VAFWRVREELSQTDRVRRSYYELLRDQLDQFMLRHALVESYDNFARNGLPYPYVEKRELKPRARLPGIEYPHHKVFLVIFVEDTIPDVHKKYIRFFDDNKTTQTNLVQNGFLPLGQRFSRNHRQLESVQFFDFCRTLLDIDYALLIQRDPTAGNRARYGLTHFHVRIDWPIADAAEDLARSLRYISKDLFENGDRYAETIQKKFFEYYGAPFMVGGRRTAAIVAAQYLKRLQCITTVYAGSTETRALIRISERGPAKLVLMKFTAAESQAIAAEAGMSEEGFCKNYVVFKEGADNVCIFQATYVYTTPSRPPDDGKLRKIKPDLSWLTVGGQHLLPKPGVRRHPPLALNLIYT